MSDAVWLAFGLLGAAVILVGVTAIWRTWRGDWDG
jgi:hypothetical protein